MLYVILTQRVQVNAESRSWQADIVATTVDGDGTVIAIVHGANSTREYDLSKWRLQVDGAPHRTADYLPL